MGNFFRRGFMSTFVLMVAMVPATSLAVATSSDFSFTHTLIQGSSGLEVSALQTLLKEQGFYTYPTITGYFGPITEAALQAFQRAKGIVSSGNPETTGYGRVGPLTRLALNAVFPSTVATGTTGVPSGPVAPPNPPTAPVVPSVPPPVTPPSPSSGGSNFSRDTIRPTVTLTAPTNGATVSGSAVTLSATASDNRKMGGVTFEVDDVIVGSEVTSEPYSVTWDSTGIPDGSKVVEAIARDAVNNMTTSGQVVVTVDNTAPTVSAISSGTPVATSTTLSWTTNELATTQVNYGLTTSYGATTTLDSTLVTSHSVLLTGLSGARTYHYRVRSTDGQGNLVVSSDHTFTTVDNVPPVISAISSGSPTDTSVTFTWTTDEPGTTQVNYGLTSSYTASSTLDATLVTSHTATVSGLTANTIYHYRVRSADTLGNLATSSDQSVETAYIGEVATRPILPNSRITTTHQMMSRRWHMASVPITSLKMVIPNWFVNTAGTGAETGSGGAASVTASIEYPAGTFTQVKFSGSVTGTIPDGASLTSDAVAVNIPQGATFYSRIYFTDAVGIVFISNPNNKPIQDVDRGDALNYGASGIPDQTMAGDVTNPATPYLAFSPAAIIGVTNAPSVCLVGDSLGFGYNDTPDASGDMGTMARSIGPSFAYINLGVSSDRAMWWLASHTQRFALTNFCSDVITDLGFNDVFFGIRTPSQVETDMQSMWTLFSTKPRFQTTITPRNVSTDNFTLLANESTTTAEAARTTVNDWLRASPSGVTRVFELADILETARNSGFWIVPNYTDDGLHPVQKGYVLIQTSGAIATSSITR